MENEIVKSQNFELVKFNSADLICPIINHEPYVVMKCIFDDLKMHTKSATGNLKKHERLGPRVVEWQPVEQIENLSNKHSYACLPIRKIAGWLYSVNISKVGKDVKPILLVYQEQCDDVLFSHFFGGKKNIVGYQEKALPLSSEIKEKEQEVREADQALKVTFEYKNLYVKKEELATLKVKRRRLERSILEPTLF